MSGGGQLRGRGGGADRPGSAQAGWLAAGGVALSKCPEPAASSIAWCHLCLIRLLGLRKDEMAFQRAAPGLWGLLVVTHDNTAHAE